MSDGPTHFKNAIFRELTKAFNVPHHFSLPYNTWSNFVVVNLVKDLFRNLSSIVSELRMGFDDWPDLLPFIESEQNTAIIASNRKYLTNY